jgi:preprotein translocase subunit SecG
MHWLTNLLMTIQVLSAIGVITLVLLQHGKGADMGAAFGSGASGSLFGATGSANFLSRTTAVLAAVFFACTLGLALLVNTRAEAPASVMDTVPAGGQDRPAPAPGPADVPSTTPADVPSAAPGGAQGAVPADVPSAAPGSDGASQKNGEASDIPK